MGLTTASLPSLFSKQLAEGLLPSRSFFAFELTNSVDVAADRLYLPLADWTTLLGSLHAPIAMRVLAHCFATDAEVETGKSNIL